MSGALASPRHALRVAINGSHSAIEVGGCLSDERYKKESVERGRGVGVRDSMGWVELLVIYLI